MTLSEDSEELILLTLNEACDVMDEFAIKFAINERKEFCTSQHFDRLVKAYYKISTNNKENDINIKITFGQCVDIMAKTDYVMTINDHIQYMHILNGTRHASSNVIISDLFSKKD